MIVCSELVILSTFCSCTQFLACVLTMIFYGLIRANKVGNVIWMSELFCFAYKKKNIQHPLDRSKIQKVEEKMRLRMERVLNHNIHLVVVVSGWIPERYGEKVWKHCIIHGPTSSKSQLSSCHLYSGETFLFGGYFFWQWLGIKNIDVAARICNITLPTPPTLQKLPWRDQNIMLLGPTNIWKTLQANLKLKLLAVVKLHLNNTSITI